ncbi:Hypothetical protein PBC10988_38520 [Planctomycetales bacterium 10988]|nr:Hypothetical protein PBC10988_38520 [Planctomycetales bacterium 10988]
MNSRLDMILSRFLLFSLLGVGLLYLPVSAQMPETQEENTKEDSPGPLVLEEPPKPLEPVHPRTKQQQDLLEATALFATGRRYEQREQYAKALQFYKRALRFEPDSIVILNQIYPLALELKRTEEALRYALKVAQLDPSNHQLVRQVGYELINQGDWKQALSLFEKTVQSDEIDKESPTYVILRSQMGDLYFVNEQYGKAAESYAIVRDALDEPEKFKLPARFQRLLRGDTGRFHERMGVSYLKSGEPKKAIKAFQKARDEEPNTGRMAFRLAQVYFQTNRPDEALAEMEIYLQHAVQPEDTEPYELLKSIYTALNKQKDLIPRLEREATANAQNFPLQMYLAELYQDRQQTGKALAIYRKLIQVNPAGNEKAADYIQEAFLGLLEIQLQQKKFAPAIQMLGRSVQSDRSGQLMARVLQGLEDYFVTEATDHRLAEEDLELSDEEEEKIDSLRQETYQKLLGAGNRLKSNRPENLGYGVRLAAAFLSLELQDWDKAEEWFRFTLETKPENPLRLYQQWGLGLLLEDENERAVAVFEEILEKGLNDTNDPLIHYHLAGALEMAGHTDRAIEIAKEAVAMRGDLALLHQRVAWIYYHAQRWPDAIEAYKSITTSFPGTDAAKQARSILSSIEVIRKNFPEAERWLEEVLDEYPDDPSASNDLGYLLADQDKQLQRAFRLVKIAIRSEPDNAAYLDSYAWTLFRLGQFEEALEYQTKAVKLEGDDPDGVLLDHLGDIYQALDRKNEAVNYWKQSLKSLKDATIPDPEREQKLQQKIEANSE